MVRVIGPLAAPSGTITVILVDEALKFPFGVDIPPNEMEFNPKKFDPVMVIVLPTFPLPGLIEDITGFGTICVVITFLCEANPVAEKFAAIYRAPVLSGTQFSHTAVLDCVTIFWQAVIALKSSALPLVEYSKETTPSIVVFALIVKGLSSLFSVKELSVFLYW